MQAKWFPPSHTEGKRHNHGYSEHTTTAPCASFGGPQCLSVVDQSFSVGQSLPNCDDTTSVKKSSKSLGSKHQRCDRGLLPQLQDEHNTRYVNALVSPQPLVKESRPEQPGGITHKLYISILPNALKQARLEPCNGEPARVQAKSAVQDSKKTNNNAAQAISQNDHKASDQRNKEGEVKQENKDEVNKFSTATRTKKQAKSQVAHNLLLQTTSMCFVPRPSKEIILLFDE